jgi:hypothetical protein
MPRLFWSCLAVALIAAGPALAAAPSESAEQNVRESAQYERLLCMTIASPRSNAAGRRRAARTGRRRRRRSASERSESHAERRPGLRDEATAPR